VTTFDEIQNLWSPLVILIGRFHSVNHTSHEVKLDFVQVRNSNVCCIYVYERYSPTYVISRYAISDLRDSQNVEKFKIVTFFLNAPIAFLRELKGNETNVKARGGGGGRPITRPTTR